MKAKDIRSVENRAVMSFDLTRICLDLATRQEDELAVKAKVLNALFPDLKHKDIAYRQTAAGYRSPYKAVQIYSMAEALGLDANAMIDKYANRTDNKKDIFARLKKANPRKLRFDYIYRKSKITREKALSILFPNEADPEQAYIDVVLNNRKPLNPQRLLRLAREMRIENKEIFDYI